MTSNVNLPGLSFVICCHNSAERLPETLNHLLRQAIPTDTPWEVLLVDNASTDATIEVAKRHLGNSNLTGDQFKIVNEPRLGVCFARYKGIAESRYEFICFVDDDNWVDETYAKEAVACMLNNPSVAACGSLNEAVFEGEIPAWFGEFQRSFAVGPQSEEGGDVTGVRGVLWSAGMVLRKSAIVELMDAGFEPIVTGAAGEKSLMRSEDYELCLALKFRGWKIWYEPRLRLKHYLPSERLDWLYLRRLLRGVGESDTGLLPYYYAHQTNYRTGRLIWLRLALNTMIRLIPKFPMLLLHKFHRFEGKQDILTVERSLGLIKSLLYQRGNFDRQVQRIVTAEWIRAFRD